MNLLDIYASTKIGYYLCVETTQMSIRPLHYFVLFLAYVEITRTIYLATVSWSSEMLNAFQHVEFQQPATSGPIDKFFLRGCLSMGAAAAAVITHQRLLMTCTMTRHHPTHTRRHYGAVQITTSLLILCVLCQPENSQTLITDQFQWSVDDEVSFFHVIIL